MGIFLINVCFFIFNSNYYVSWSYSLIAFLDHSLSIEFANLVHIFIVLRQVSYKRLFCLNSLWTANSIVFLFALFALQMLKKTLFKHVNYLLLASRQLNSGSLVLGKTLSKTKACILYSLQLFFNLLLFFRVSSLFDHLLIFPYLSFSLCHRIKSFVVCLELSEKLNVGLWYVVKVTLPNEFVNRGPDRQNYGCYWDS